MQLRTALLGGAAFSLVLSLGAGATAQAAVHKKMAHAKVTHGAASDRKMDAILAEMHELRANLAAETAARLQLEAQLQRTTSAALAAQSQVRTAEAQVQAVQAQAGPPQPIQTAQAQTAADAEPGVETIPNSVAEKRGKVSSHAPGIQVGGVRIIPGGFIEAAGVYRQHDTANDISTALNTIPFPQTRQGHLEQYVFTPRQSRVSALVEGDPTPDLTLSMYGEFDFQGAAQSANSNETNSYNPRIRHLYGTMDWADSGWHFLAGQTFSLVTMDSKGVTPRNEVTPLTIDGQYHVGFTWARQPLVRVVKDMFDKSVWVAVSAENPQTTFTGTAPTGVISTINNGQGYYAGETNGGVAATQSVNHIPDFVAKAVVEKDIAGHHVHAEVYGLARSFYEQLADFKTNNITTGAVGGGFIAQVIPGWFDVQASALNGKGIGRYGSGQLPDVTFNVNGRIEPIEETIALVGGVVHATKSLDLWAYGGEEHDSRAAYGAIGYGNPAAINSGCEVQGSPLTCTGNTRLLAELSGGFWQKLYNGPWGQIRLGLQYSYVERDAFSGVGGAPTAHENMLYTSFRYYPFQ